MDYFETIRAAFAQTDLEWRNAFRVAFEAFIAQDGFNDLEFIHYAGIRPTDWVRLCSKNTISNDAWIYAKIFYHAGIVQADPRQLPPRMLVQFGGEVVEKRRAILPDDFQTWIQAQKPSFISIWQGGVAVEEVNESLKTLATIISTLITGERGQRDEFTKTNRKILSFIIPYLTALSLDGAARERELVRLITLSRTEVV